MTDLVPRTQEAEAGLNRRKSCPTAAEIRAWPAAVDVVKAGTAYGIGATTARDLARRGLFPAPVLRIGRQMRCPTAGILASLGLTVDASESS